MKTIWLKFLHRFTSLLQLYNIIFKIKNQTKINGNLTNIMNCKEMKSMTYTKDLLLLNAYNSKISNLLLLSVLFYPYFLQTAELLLFYKQ